jgi:hypothetical protein
MFGQENAQMITTFKKLATLGVAIGEPTVSQ